MATEDRDLVPLPVPARAGVTPPAAPERKGPRGGRPVPLLAAAVLTVVVVVAAVVAVVGTRLGGAPSERSPAERSPEDAAGASWWSEPGAAATGDEAPPAGWRRGMSGPLRPRDGHVAVWTGSELLVWGGDPEGDGAAYDPQRDRWRPVPPAPFPPRVFPASAWTGFELIVWGGRPGGGAASLATGAAYEPVTRRWRRLPPAPLGPRTPLAGIWTGEELVVVGGAGERQERLTDAAAYHPQLDRWRPIAPLPVPLDEAVGLWTGREVVVVGDRVAAWDPRADRWRELPAAPLATGALTAVWTGEHVLAWDFELHAAALDVAREGAWRRLPDLPLDFRDCEPAGVLAGDVVFAEHCGQGAVYHPALREWRRVPHPRELSATPRWTGRELVFWVGNFAGSHDGVWRFRPPGRRPRGPVPP